MADGCESVQNSATTASQPDLADQVGMLAFGMSA